MQIKVTGLVVMETNLGERDKIITILTSEKGLIRAITKGVKSISNKNVGATQLFSYSRFILYKGKSGYIVDDSEIQEVFFNLRNSIEKIALSQYFCDLALALSPEDGDARDFLRLMLNSFDYLCNEKRNFDMIKSIVEMKMISLAGYMPDVVCCQKCGKYEDDLVYFSFELGSFYCGCCKDGLKNKCIAIRKGTLIALRHIIYAPFNKLFNFRLSDNAQSELTNLCENYVIYQLDRRFKTLDFYKSLTNYKFV